MFFLLLTLNHIRTIAPPGGNYILYTLHLNMIGVNCLQTLEWRPNFNWTKDKLLIQSVVKHFLDGWWKVPAKSPPPTPPSAPYYRAVNFHHFFQTKCYIFVFTLLHHVLWKLHKCQFYPMVSNFVAFLE